MLQLLYTYSILCHKKLLICNYWAIFYSPPRGPHHGHGPHGHVRQVPCMSVYRHTTLRDSCTECVHQSPIDPCACVHGCTVTVYSHYGFTHTAVCTKTWLTTLSGSEMRENASRAAKRDAESCCCSESDYSVQTQTPYYRIDTRPTKSFRQKSHAPVGSCSSDRMQYCHPHWSLHKRSICLVLCTQRVQEYTVSLPLFSSSR